HPLRRWCLWRRRSRYRWLFRTEEVLQGSEALLILLFSYASDTLSCGFRSRWSWLNRQVWLWLRRLGPNRPDNWRKRLGRLSDAGRNLWAWAHRWPLRQPVLDEL